MKKLVRLFTLLTSVISMAVLGVFGISAHADETPLLQYQEETSQDMIRYIGTISGLTNLSDLTTIDVNMTLSKDSTTLTGHDTITTVYKTVSNAYKEVDGEKVYYNTAQAGVYYAVYTLNELSEYYAGWTLTTSFTYTYSDSTKKVTNEKSYVIPETYTISCVLPDGWDSINVYMWNSSNTSIYNKAYPGVKVSATETINGNNVCKICIPSTAGYDKIIFSNVTYSDLKTEDLNLPSTSKTYNLLSLSFTVTDSAWENTVYAYCWNDSTGAKNADFPGSKMVASGTNSMGQNLYSILIESSQYDKVIFASGKGWQSANLDINNQSDNWYFDSNGNLTSVKTRTE